MIPALISLTALVALTACSGEGTAVGAGDGSGTTTTQPAVNDQALALQIRTGGGFVPTDLTFATTPEFTLYADGRVIVSGPTTMEYPGRALPNLQVGTIDDKALGDAIKSARDAGVAENPELGRPAVADAPTTTFVLVDRGRTSTVDAYALGFESAVGLSAAQKEARQRLTALAEAMRRVGADAVTEAYRATTVSVLVLPYAQLADGRPDGGQAAEPTPGQADWPLADLSAGGRVQFGGRCLGLTGTDAERLLAVADHARSNTHWRSGARDWSLTFRPELPGVGPCAER